MPNQKIPGSTLNNQPHFTEEEFLEMEAQLDLESEDVLEYINSKED